MVILWNCVERYPMWYYVKWAKELSIETPWLKQTIWHHRHSIFNSAKHLEDNVITVFEHHVAEFMLYFRSNWPSINISKKLHLLEYHTAHFLRLWGTGCGLYGEQGEEFTHNGINRMKHRYANVKNDLSRLEYIMNQSD